MNVRKRDLPVGWYPASNDEIAAMVRQWQKKLPVAEKNLISGIVPHAGWVFSGSIAYNIIRRINEDIETVVIIGGHLPKNGGILLYPHDGWETPSGIAKFDKEFIEDLSSKISVKKDISPDNTVESVVPLVSFLCPEKKIIPMRVEQSGSAADLGEAIFNTARGISRKTVVIGSTDLTHYGSSYGFSPMGTGIEAERWVREENDKNVIEALLNFNASGVLEAGVEKRAACSAGAALAAMKFAELNNCTSGELIEYKTSLEVHRAESFVGYAGIVYYS